MRISARWVVKCRWVVEESSFGDRTAQVQRFTLAEMKKASVRKNLA
jgi:hypothetical protein